MSLRWRGVPAWVWLIAIVPLSTVGLGIASALSVPLLRRYWAPPASANHALGPEASASNRRLSPLQGEAADLSSVMGRARKLADTWQREAALLGIEAVLVGKQVRTLEGASAKLTFGPSPFASAKQGGGLFIMTYDKTGLHGSATPGQTTKALPEPMCAPEHVLTHVVDLGAIPVSLRYGFDSDERALWFTNPVDRPEELRVFDPQDCRQRGNIVVAPRWKR